MIKKGKSKERKRTEINKSYLFLSTKMYDKFLLRTSVSFSKYFNFLSLKNKIVTTKISFSHFFTNLSVVNVHVFAQPCFVESMLPVTCHKGMFGKPRSSSVYLR